MRPGLLAAVFTPVLSAVLAAGLASCHLTESTDDVLELTLNDSLRAYATVEVVILDITGTQTFAELWNAPLPNPPIFRYKLDKVEDHAFLVRVFARDGAGDVKQIKTLAWKDGKQQPGVHVIDGARAEYRIAGFRVSTREDQDGDGFARAYRAVLDVDANTNFDTLSAKLFYQVEGNTGWQSLAERGRFTVQGKGPADSIFMAVDGGAQRTVNLKAIVYTRDGTPHASAEVKGVKEETAVQDD
jgi:hypothetical protein